MSEKSSRNRRAGTRECSFAPAVLLFLSLAIIPATAGDVGTAPGDTIGTAGFEMILVTPGTFMMGSPTGEPGRDDDEQLHKVTLTREFQLGKTEVTQRQWLAVMGRNPSKLKGIDLPVEMVSWRDCVNFCNALSKREGLTPVYEISRESVVWNQSANGYRLPTEAEWEFACRAGTTGPHAGDLDKMAVYSLNSGRKTRTVGTRKANAWGFHDMHGNVWEWCWDRYEKNYGSNHVMDPVGPGGDLYRVERGGSWHRNVRDCRSASRGADDPGAHRNGLGFRLARWAR